MNYYDNFQPETINSLKKLNDDLIQEEGRDIVDKYKVLKLKQQILMKGLELSVKGFL